MNINFLDNFKFCIYGESHGDSIGGIIYMIPSNFSINIDRVNEELTKRNPSTAYNTPRKDSPSVYFESGFKAGKTTGTPLVFKLYNDDVKSKDYDKDTFRLNHADYTSYKKFGENYPYAGSGPFSGRITAVIIVIGEIARQILKQIDINIEVFPNVIMAGKYQGETIKDIEIIDLQKNIDEELFVYGQENASNLLNHLLDAKQKQDSIGAKIEFKVSGIKDNLGDLYFDSFESILSHALFSIPGIKGVDFGIGQDFATSFGTDLGSEFDVEDNVIKVFQNINGGINGGITNGYEDVFFSCIIKPPVSVKQKQNLLKIEAGEFKKIRKNVEGRHDTYIGNKIVPIVKAWLNIIILDMYLENTKHNFLKGANYEK